jgi:hypothetical protein
MVTLEHGLLKDEALAERVHAALMDLQPPLHLALPMLRVSLKDEQVTVSGNVATASQKEAVGRRLARLSGVRRVVNNIVDDGNLTLDVWSALAGIQQLRGVDRRLKLVLGTVHLEWVVRDPEREAVVDRVLAGIPGVRGIVHGTWPPEECRRPVPHEALLVA